MASSLTHYVCKHCDYSVDHPIDACPVCGSVFYWLVLCETGKESLHREEFIEKMRLVSADMAKPDFMFYGGKIWLPPNFWQKQPTGEILHEMAWIESLQLVQYKKSRGKSVPAKEADKQGEEGYETNPGMVVSQNIVLPETPVSEKQEDKPVEVLSAESIREVPKPSLWSRFKGPVSIGFFLTFLAFGYFFLCLGQQRNKEQHRKEFLSKQGTHEVNQP